MVKRTSSKTYFYLVFALFVMITCWEANITNAALVEREIPKDSIRLRILANSDAPNDQWIKRKVRDAVTSRMNGWVTGPQDIESARATVRAHIGDLQQAVGEVLQEYGYSYGYKVELGIVPFPTKMYGDKVYPAGNYEALRVTLGRGEGQNWWCVLFPPLCFVDAASGDAIDKKTTAKEAGANKQEAKTVKSADRKTAKSDDDKTADQEGTVQTAAAAPDAQDNGKPEVKFFLWEIIKSIIEFIKGLFG